MPASTPGPPGVSSPGRAACGRTAAPRCCSTTRSAARTATALADVDAELRASLEELAIDLVALAGPDTVGVRVVDDVDGTYRSWLDDLAADVVLVRPDFHVYGTGGSDDALELATGFLARLDGLRAATVG